VETYRNRIKQLAAIHQLMAREKCNPDQKPFIGGVINYYEIANAPYAEIFIVYMF